MTEKSVDRLPEEIRESVREAIAQLDSVQPAQVARRGEAASPRAEPEIKMLKKQMNSLEQKLENELQAVRERLPAKPAPRRKAKP